MNTSIMDKETYERLQGALEGLKEMTQKNQQKRELKMWNDMSVPLTINDALTRFSKDDLSAIRRRLDIKGASQLKKAELIDLLNRKIPLSLEQICMYLDQERYNIIKKVVHHGGCMEAPKLTANQLDYFRNLGIIFTGTFEGKKIIAMPEEIVTNQFFQDNQKQLITLCRRNTEWIKVTQGLLYYYGTLTLSELHNLLEKYMNKPVRLSDYLAVIDHAISYYDQIRRDQYGFSNLRVFDPEKVRREHKARRDLAFFPFTKQQLLRAGEPGYIERNDSYLHFVHFLTQNYEMNRQEADGMVEECVYAANLEESLNQIFQYLESRIEIENIEMVKACMDKVVNLVNNTKQWSLKGYSPRELSRVNEQQQSLQPLPNPKEKMVDFTTRQKIGRNDLCPCGSNKKYKKCCGR